MVSTMPKYGQRKAGRATAHFNGGFLDSLVDTFWMVFQVTQVLNSLQGDLKGTYYPLDGMSEDVRTQLVNDHFLFKKGK